MSVEVWNESKEIMMDQVDGDPTINANCRNFNSESINLIMLHELSGMKTREHECPNVR